MALKTSRRKLLKGLGAVGVLGPLLAACQPKQQTPTPGTVPPGEQPKVDTPQPAPGVRPQLRSTLWVEQSGEGRTWMADKALEWAEVTGLADVEIEMVSYGEMQSQMLTAVAAGILWDVFFNNVRWGPYAAHRGVTLPLDDLVDANDTDLGDFVPETLVGSRFDGQLFGLPAEFNTGNHTIVFYHKGLLDEFGVPEPTDDWTVQDFAEMAARATDRDRRIYGTNFLPSQLSDFAALARTFGGDVFDEEKRNFTLTTDPNTVDAMRWLVNLRTEYQAAPDRDEAQGLTFFAEQLSILTGATYTIGQAKVNIEDRFEWDAVLTPLGPGGLRGYSLFILQMSVGSTTQHPQEAFSLLEYLTSAETQHWSLVNQGQPTSRLSVLRSPEALAIHPIWGRVADWMEDGVNRGPLPVPWNLRTQEVSDTFLNISPELMYGEVPFDQGMEQLQRESQNVMQLPRP
jgi:ABC-type glycerol-3-phosphate transport system substrate-binding protein